MKAGIFSRLGEERIDRMNQGKNFKLKDYFQGVRCDEDEEECTRKRGRDYLAGQENSRMKTMMMMRRRRCTLHNRPVRWSFFQNDGMVNVFLQGTISINGFSMVLPALNHHALMFFDQPTIDFNGF